MTGATDGTTATRCCIGGGGPAGIMLGFLLACACAGVRRLLGMGVRPEHVRSPKA